MTGFGKAEFEANNKKFTIEIKSLNSKQIDINTRIPAIYREKDIEIRKVLSEKYGELSQEISILYGGSCKPNNAEELFSKEDVDGGLIGGASLEAASFISIFKAL